MERRVFLKNSGIATAGALVVPLITRCGVKNPNGLITIGMIGAAFAVAFIFSNLLNAIARNPSAEAQMARYAIIGAGMAEAIGIFALCVAMILIFI